MTPRETPTPLTHPSLTECLCRKAIVQKLEKLENLFVTLSETEEDDTKLSGAIKNFKSSISSLLLSLESRYECDGAAYDRMKEIMDSYNIIVLGILPKVLRSASTFLIELKKDTSSKTEIEKEILAAIQEISEELLNAGSEYFEHVMKEVEALRDEIRKAVFMTSGYQK